MLASDHSIVMLSLQWSGPPAVSNTSLCEQRNTKRIELSHYNADVTEEYCSTMQEWHDSYVQSGNNVPSADDLLAVMKQSVVTANKLQSKKSHLRQKVGFKSPFKDGYSPCYIAILSAYKILINYHHRLLCCTRANNSMLLHPSILSMAEEISSYLLYARPYPRQSTW